MKKRVLSILITVLTVCASMFMLTACNEEGAPTHTHVYDQQIANEVYLATDATCEEKATYYVSCICGAKGTATFESGNGLVHSFSIWFRMAL